MKRADWCSSHDRPIDVCRAILSAIGILPDGTTRDPATCDRVPGTWVSDQWWHDLGRAVGESILSGLGGPDDV